jgi:hypothetical protein
MRCRDRRAVVELERRSSGLLAGTRKRRSSFRCPTWRHAEVVYAGYMPGANDAALGPALWEQTERLLNSLTPDI